MKIFNTSGDLFNSILSYLSQISSGLFTAIKDAILGIFISIYMLTSKEHLHAQARRITAALFKEKNRNHILRYRRIANRTFGNFFVGIIIDAILITIVTFVALTIFRVPYAILVSVIVGCTNIIPVFGPFIGAIPSAFIIFVKEPSKALVFIILILIIQQIEGNIIAPKILGNSTGVSPLGVIVAIILMGAYLGVIGMIIGVPIFAMILTVCNEIIETRLKANGLPTDTAEYYPAYSLVDPNERHEKLINRIFDTTKNICLKIIKIFKKKSKKVNPDTEKETQNNDERSE
jgi:predicted PurR-regulated permease PerM